jgi:hypothetical protein
MKFNPPQVLYAVGVLALTVFFSCSKSDGPERQLIKPKDISLDKMANINCFDPWNYTLANYYYALLFPCEVSANHIASNLAAVDRQKRIDSIIKANSYKYPEHIFSTTPSPCTTPPGNYTWLPLFGTSAVFNTVDGAISEFYGTSSAVFTIYVLQNGMHGGGVFLGLQNAANAKTFGFYPNQTYIYPTSGCGVSARSSSLTVPGEIRNNADIVYSVSISKTLSSFQLQNLFNYLRNTGGSFYNYSLSYFNEVHYALGAANAIGLSVYEPVGDAYGISSTPRTPYELAQNIAVMTSTPSGVTINKLGGITPGVSDITD